MLVALRERCPATPIVVVASPGDEDEWQDLPGECQLIASPVVPDELVTCVRGALAGFHTEV
ncbi:MAG TPA: hypothetical protein VF025_00590 [Gaiellaceae bacterium]